MLKGIAAQPLTSDRREQRAATILFVSDPRCKQFGRVAAQRGCALFPAFPHTADVCAGSEYDIGPREANQL